MNYNFVLKVFHEMENTAYSLTDTSHAAAAYISVIVFLIIVLFIFMGLLGSLAIDFGKATLKSKDLIKNYTRKNSISTKNGELVSIKSEMVDFHFQCKECVIFVERSHGTGYVEKTWKIPYEKCEFIENEEGIFEVKVLTDIKTYKLTYLYSLLCGLLKAYRTEEEVKESIPHYIINMPKGYSIEDMKLPLFF